MFDIDKLCKIIRISTKDAKQYEKYLSEMQSIITLIPETDVCKKLSDQLDLDSEVREVKATNVAVEANISHPDALSNGRIKGNYFYSKRSVS